MHLTARESKSFNSARKAILPRGMAIVASTAIALVCIVNGPALAQEKAKPAANKSAYKAPRNVWGQPDLGDSWSNATLTTERRPQGVSSLVYTPEEVKKLEDRSRDEVAAGNLPTDPNGGAEQVAGSVETLRDSYARASGGTGGYNRGWLDPGSTVMRVNGQPRSSILITPDGQIPKPKPGATLTLDRGGGEDGPAGKSDNPEDRTVFDRCLAGRGPPILPNGFYNNNYKIVQSADSVAILVEMIHDVRHVALNRKEHLPSNLRPWGGDSIGRWEGDTLVVETTNIPKAQAYNGSWERLKITERFTRVGSERLHYHYTVEDPTIWEKPFSGEYEFTRLNGQLYEYACHEGNYAMEGILAGARQMERDAAAQTTSGATTR